MTTPSEPTKISADEEEMRPPLPPLELTLVLAATRDMGIGRAGTLPWTGLKKEMAYFARVTKRLPANSPPTALNAVIMGRKTWDSIPPRFRPLKGRLNVVLSRSFPPPPPPFSASADEPGSGSGSGTAGKGEDADDLVVRAPSLPSALAHLRLLRQRQQRSSSSSSSSLPPPLGHVFIVGGAQVYDAALALAETRRVLLTSVLSDFECDTFVSALKLGAPSPSSWRRVGKEGFDAWVGEVVPAGVQEENGTEYEFQMWERGGDGVD